jgi:hypothetical protein
MGRRFFLPAKSCPKSCFLLCPNDKAFLRDRTSYAPDNLFVLYAGMFLAQITGRAQLSLRVIKYL